MEDFVVLMIINVFSLMCVVECMVDFVLLVGLIGIMLLG